ncbi:MAG: TrpR-related protein YerC/YecD [Clostridiales bacterium]|nr:TrpR-related protein YerC/YecD [Candidatus Equinaster intestinalis]
MEKKQEKIDRLYEVILKLKTKEDCAALFEDLCTKKEVEKMADRIDAADLLIRGMTYSEVIAKTNISSATLSRVSRSIQYGNGYSKFLK